MTTFALLSLLFLFSLAGNPLVEDDQDSVSKVQAHSPDYFDDGTKVQNTGPSLSSKIAAAKAALEKEHFDEAVARFEELVSASPDVMTKVSTPYSQAIMGQALRAASRNPKEVEPLLLKALRVDPHNVRARFELGSLYLARKDFSKAIETYRRVIERDPQFHRAAFNLAYAYAAKKDYTRAEQMYRRVIDLSPPYADEALFNLAIVQAKQGKTNQSILSLEKALAMNPNNKDAKNFLLKLKGKNTT